MITVVFDLPKAWPRLRAMVAALAMTSMLISPVYAAQGGPASSTNETRAQQPQALAPVQPLPPAAAPSAMLWRPWDADTLVWQSVGAVAGGLGGAVAGMLLTAGYLQVASSGGDGWGDIAFLLLGGMAGGMGGMAAGTWFSGDLMGGNGSLGWTILGTFGGTISGFAVGGAAEQTEAVFIGGLIGGVVGGIAAYHLSATPNAPPVASAAMRVGSDGRVHVGVPLALPYSDRSGRITGWQLSLVSGRF